MDNAIRSAAVAQIYNTYTHTHVILLYTYMMFIQLDAGGGEVATAALSPSLSLSFHHIKIYINRLPFTHKNNKPFPMFCTSVQYNTLPQHHVDLYNNNTLNTYYIQIYIYILYTCTVYARVYLYYFRLH